MNSIENNIKRAHKIFSSGVKAIREGADANGVTLLDDPGDTPKEKALLKRWSDPAMIAQDCSMAIG